MDSGESGCIRQPCHQFAKARKVNSAVLRRSCTVLLIHTQRLPDFAVCRRTRLHLYCHIRAKALTEIAHTIKKKEGEKPAPFTCPFLLKQRRSPVGLIIRPEEILYLDGVWVSAGETGEADNRAIRELEC